MNKKTVSKMAVFGTLLSLAACGGSSNGGVGSGGGSGGTGTAPEVVMVQLGTSVKNIEIQSGVATQFSFTYDMPAGLLSQPITAYQDFTVNLAETMPHVQITSSAVADNA